MSNSHIKTAHDWGVQQALEQAGYKSVDDLHKEAAAIGLVETPKPSTKVAESNDAIAALFRTQK